MSLLSYITFLMYVLVCEYYKSLSGDGLPTYVCIYMHAYMYKHIYIDTYHNYVIHISHTCAIRNSLYIPVNLYIMCVPFITYFTSSIQALMYVSSLSFPLARLFWPADSRESSAGVFLQLPLHAFRTTKTSCLLDLSQN